MILIPSLDALFENLNYLKVLVDCMTRLVRLLPSITVSSVFFKAFSDTNQRPDRAVIQVTEFSLSSSPASSTDRAGLGVCAKPEDVEKVSTVSTIIAEFLTTTHRATAGNPLDVGFRSSSSRLFIPPNAMCNSRI